MIAAGRRSKTSSIAFMLTSGSTVSVPKVSSDTDTGRATPIA
jgi:hypothetical protein